MSPQSVVHYGDLRPHRPRILNHIERFRTKYVWLIELYAEAFGVFLYTYFGVGSQTLYVLGNILKVEGASSVLQIGMGYGCGILMAITVCNPSSGGHFNPAVSCLHVLFNGFPPMKGLRYIVAQIFGAYIACLLIYVQYKSLFIDATLALEAAGPGILEATFFTPNGPGGAIGLYLPAGANIGRVFVNEFVTDFILGTVIFACLDYSNDLIPPSLGAIVVSLAYTAAVWSFSAPGLAANSARDVGGRLAALTIWGRQAGGGSYAAVAALTNIPATLIAGFMYEVFLVDGRRAVPSAHQEYLRNHFPQFFENATARDGSSDISDRKAEIGEVERV
uniref:Glycerol uptake n=1 Tax=Mycena chlorophos TaxID=658473 RepID=A0ABQ0M5R7_MYCCL|nr:glycerol uptake [Mycena chlorophos]